MVCAPSRPNTGVGEANSTIHVPETGFICVFRLTHGIDIGSMGRPRKKIKNIEWVANLCRYDKTYRGVRFKSPLIYTNADSAQAALVKAIEHYQETGQLKVFAPISENEPSEPTIEVYKRWINWLKLHRSPRHHYDMNGLLARACNAAPEYALIPANMLTENEIEAWGEIWAADLMERGKGLGEINKWLRYSQTAFNEPWGKRRSKPLRDHNPWQYVERYAITKKAKYVPTTVEVKKILMAAEGEFRLYLEILYETASRVSEGRTLAWEHVRYEHAPYSLTLHTKKTEDGSLVSRPAAISRTLASRFRAWRRSQPDGALYVFQQESKKEPRVTTWERRCMIRTCLAAEVEYFPPSCMRHYRASAWARDGVPLTTIQGRLGHTQATTTNNYLSELQIA